MAGSSSTCAATGDDGTCGWAASRPESLARVRAELTAGAWLEGSARQRHLARTTLPIVLATTGVAGLILLWALSALNL